MVNVEVKNSFVVMDRYENPILKGEVLRIDENEIYFKSTEGVFRMRCGDFLGSVIRSPLSSREVKELKLVSAEKET